MNVAHLTTVHRRDDTRIFHKMCRSLAQSGHAVTLYVADGLGGEWRHGVRIIDIGRPRNRALRACLTSARMWLRAGRSSHDILHFHDPELIVGGLIARLSGQCIIYDIHEYYRQHLKTISALPKVLNELLASVYDQAERWASRFLSACIVVSPHMLTALRVRTAVVIENHVRPEEIQPETTRFSERPYLLSYVGVLSTDRCVETMVDAVAGSGCRLALAGKWYPPSYRDQMINRPGWRQVEEWGIIDRDQVQRLLGQSRAGLLINNLHGDEEHSSSNKLFEYMAAGLPVIATDRKFARDVIEQHHCGLLVSPATNPDAVRAAIDWILEHPNEAERMGKAGREAIENHYCWNRMHARLLTLYADLKTPDRQNRR
jgi:glycosyltransferase involved in cell wall biosynthesis